MPIVPDSGEECPLIYKTIQTESPSTDELIAPALFAFFKKSPQIKGPKKTDPIAPHEIPKIATIVAGLNKAKTTDNNIKKALDTRIIKVKLLSVAFAFTNP